MSHDPRESPTHGLVQSHARAFPCHPIETETWVRGWTREGHDSRNSPPPLSRARSGSPAEVDGWNDERFDGEGDRARAMRDGDARWSTREDDGDDDATREDDGEVRARGRRRERETTREGVRRLKVRGFPRWVTR